MSSAEIAQPFFFSHLKIWDHFCHSSEVWRLFASYSFFSALLPFIIATQGAREGAQILLGPLEWVRCGDWNHGEQGAGIWELQPLGRHYKGSIGHRTGEFSCSLVKEMKQLLRRRHKLSMSAWNLLLSDSSALGTLKINRNNSCSKKNLLECAELHSPGTQHQNPVKGRRSSYSRPISLSRKGEGRGKESMKLLLPVPHLNSTVKLYWLKTCPLQIIFYYNYQQSDVHLNVWNQGLVE